MSGVFSVQYSKSEFSSVEFSSGFGDLFNKEKTGFLKKLEVTAPEIDHCIRLAKDKI